jgi:hypothetical protein
VPYYYFLATIGTKTAITTDARGLNLPPLKSGRWQFVKTLHILDVVREATPADILLAIDRDGYWISSN